MTIVKVRLERYAISWKHLCGLVDEFCGGQLCVSANAEEAEFGFNVADHAKQFRDTLEKGFKKPEPKPQKGKSPEEQNPFM